MFRMAGLLAYFAALPANSCFALVVAKYAHLVPWFFGKHKLPELAAHAALWSLYICAGVHLLSGFVGWIVRLCSHSASPPIQASLRQAWCYQKEVIAGAVLGVGCLTLGWGVFLFVEFVLSSDEVLSMMGRIIAAAIWVLACLLNALFAATVGYEFARQLSDPEIESATWKKAVSRYFVVPHMKRRAALEKPFRAIEKKLSSNKARYAEWQRSLEESEPDGGSSDGYSI